MARSAFVRPYLVACVVLRRKEVELSVERELSAGPDGAPRRARLTGRFTSDSAEVVPGPEELRAALIALAGELDRAVDGLEAAPVSRPHDERDLAELVETYRPRQPELLELLRAEGELSPREYELLRSHVRPSAGGGGPRADAMTNVREPSPPLSGPAAEPRPRSAARPVPELLRTYGISSLRQAGAVRARRQISFEEYMALKQYFTTASPAKPGDGGETRASGL